MTPLPEIIAEDWLNTESPLSLAALRGKVVVIEAFQMLCPGCVSHGLPLAQRIAAVFPADRVQVIGLHCVFEHHDAMRKPALEAFAYEYRIGFPIAIDRPSAGGTPETMALWGLRGTPSLLIVDPQGGLQAHYFGDVSELAVGAQIGALLASSARAPAAAADADGGCDAQGCVAG